MTLKKEKMLHRKTVYEGKMLHVYYDDVEIGGRRAWREIVLHPGAAAVIPITEDGQILFVRQYRYAVEKSLLEIPAGKMDAGETAEECASRELTEETGYRAGRLVHLGDTLTSPGFCNEVIHLYLADHLIPAHQHLDPDEYLDVVAVPLDTAWQHIRQGMIQDAKTLAAFAIAGERIRPALD